MDVLLSLIARMAGVPGHGRIRGRGKEQIAVFANAALREIVAIAVREKVAQEVVRVLDMAASPQRVAMSSARPRGATYARQQYDEPLNLLLADSAKLSGISDRVINERRNAGQYYALILDGNSRRFRYPSWQFDARPERLARVAI